MNVFISLLLVFVSVLVSVAFFTLFERKLLGYIQLRKGPNKVGVIGLLQPFSDAVKLFTKEMSFPLLSNFFPYMMSPIIGLFLALMVWVTIPSFFNIMSFDLGLLFFLCCTSMGVYTLLGAGWSSNSKYALLGALRAVAQTISYEVSLALLLLCVVLVVGSYSLYDLLYFQKGMSFIFLFPVLALVWLVSCLAETNRTPFDFAEGESELVSGYNVEYSSGGFALIMMAEYTSILFMSTLFVVMFLGGSVGGFMYLAVFFTSFVFVWVRGTLPRFRYDKLMSLAWKSYLPFALCYLLFIVGVLSVL